MKQKKASVQDGSNKPGQANMNWKNAGTNSNRGDQDETPKVALSDEDLEDATIRRNRKEAQSH